MSPVQSSYCKQKCLKLLNRKKVVYMRDYLAGWRYCNLCKTGIAPEDKSHLCFCCSRKVRTRKK